MIFSLISKIKGYIVLYVIVSTARIRYFRSKEKGLKEIKYKNNHKKCLVLGNGPSLKNDIEEIKLQVGKCDFFAVNHFCESPDFKLIKPNKYALLDQYFWAQDACEELKQKRETMFKEINKADWEIVIYVPHYCDKNYINSMIVNEKIEIQVYKVIPIQTLLPRDDVILKLFESGIYGPAACNVLIYGIYIAILAGYTNIDIYGADLSFHNDILVDQSNNTLKVQYKHFYGETEYVPFMKNPQRTSHFKMSEFMQWTFETFLAHDRLNKYAEKKSIEIRNKSSFSMIDSYKR